MLTISEIENIVLKRCSDNECKNQFYIIGKNGIEYCKCHEKLLRYNRYNKANIEVEWWDFEYEDLLEEFKKNKEILKIYNFFVNNIDLCIKNKVQFLFQGDIGLGKTTLAILMLKSALDRGYGGLMLTGDGVIEKLYNGLKKDMDIIDFLVVDEYDRISRKSTVIDFCNLMSSYIERKGIILLGNKSIQGLKNNGYDKFFIDRLNLLKKIEFKGESLRGKIKSKFETLIEEKK